MGGSRSETESQPLIGLGFTALEAEVYLFLIGETAATGYRIAQATGRSVGNVYKAVEALEAKGAVITTEEGDARAVRAVAFAEVAARARKQLDHAIELSAGLAARAEMPAADERVYTLRDASQVYERAGAMIRAAKSFVLATLCPGPLAELLPVLRSVLDLGRRVGVKCFRPVEAAGADIVLDPRGESVFEAAPGQWLNLTADGEGWLHALFSLDGESLLEAYWTANPLLCWTAFTGLSSDFVLAAVRNELRAAEGKSAEDALRLVEAVQERLRIYETPRSTSKLALMRRYRDPAPGRRRRES